LGLKPTAGHLPDQRRHSTISTAGISKDLPSLERAEFRLQQMLLASPISIASVSGAL
jgi:hypothetical protein